MHTSSLPPTYAPPTIPPTHPSSKKSLSHFQNIHFALQPTEFNQGLLCDHGFGTIFWNLVGSTPPVPESLSREEFKGQGWEGPHEPLLIPDLLLTQPVLSVWAQLRKVSASSEHLQ